MSCEPVPDMWKDKPKTPLEAVAPSQGLSTLASSPLPESEPGKKLQQQKVIRKKMPATQAVLDKMNKPKDLIFERTLRLWLPYNGLPAAVVTHSHEVLELRKMYGQGRLLLHAHTDLGEPTVVGAALLDSSAFLRPNMNFLSCKRKFPYLPGLTLAFSSEPTTSVDLHALSFATETSMSTEQNDSEGLTVEFVITAHFTPEERLKGVPISQTSSQMKKPQGYADHPLRRVFRKGNSKANVALVNGKANTQDEQGGENQRLPQIRYAATPTKNTSIAAARPTPNSATSKNKRKKKLPVSNDDIQQDPSSPLLSVGSPSPPKQQITGGDYFDRRAKSGAAAVFPPPRNSSGDRQHQLFS